MRTLALTIAVALLVTVSPVMAQSAADEAAIKKGNEQIDAAWNSKDKEAFLALIDEQVENWGGTRKGKAAYMEGILPGWAHSKDGHGKLTEDIGIVFVTPDVAMWKGRVESSGYRDENGNPVPPAMNLVARVWAKKNGKWLNVAYFSRTIEE